jgi:hypothetical protein
MGNSEKPPSWWDKNRHLQPRPIPRSYTERLGKPTSARIPWESAPIEASARAASVGEVRGQPATLAKTAKADLSLDGAATGEVRTLLPRHRASEVISSSSWTGRRSLREQVTVVQSLAPLALESIDQLVSAVEQKRLNDPAAQDALAALKELHAVLGELIGLAESKRSMKRAWKRFEAAKERLTDALWDGAQLIVVAPTLAMGTATFLSMLSGFPISEGMVTALCAASMTKDALLTVAKRR